MNKLYAVLVASGFLFGACESEEANPNAKKDLYLKMTGTVDVQSGDMNGRTLTNETVYYFVEIHSPTGLYASGLFDQLPDSLKVSLLDNTNYYIAAKAVSSFESGLDLMVYENPKTIYYSFPVTNQIEYNNQQYLNASYGWAYLVSADDPYNADFYYYPPINTFYKELNFNTGQTNVVNLELSRKVFGVETHVLGMSKGEVRVLLGDAVYTSVNAVTYPDTVGNEVLSFLNLQHNEATLPVKVFYDDGSTEHLLYDNSLTFNRLEKKKFIVNLATASRGDTKGITITILDEPLYAGEEIVIE